MNASTVTTPHPTNKKPLIAVIGATSVGKTAAAIRLAREVRGEIVSADSRYLYRGMDIGTATPGEDEMEGVPHHLINLLDPTDDYTLTLYLQDALQAIDDVHRREHVPILAGGTPLYVNALLEGWRVPNVPPNPEFRSALEAMAATEGAEVLHRRLRQVDPVAAERIPATNVRRVIRALEIHHHTGQRMSEIEGKSPPSFRALIIGLRLPREELYRRIDARVDDQIEQGLVDEVRALLEAGIPANAPSMSAIGYPEIIDYLDGRLTLDEAIARIKFHTHRYARHQLTWLRRMHDVNWFDPSEPGWFERASMLTRTFVGQ